MLYTIYKWCNTLRVRSLPSQCPLDSVVLCVLTYSCDYNVSRLFNIEFLVLQVYFKHCLLCLTCGSVIFTSNSLIWMQCLYIFILTVFCTKCIVFFFIKSSLSRLYQLERNIFKQNNLQFTITDNCNKVYQYKGVLNIHMAAAFIHLKEDIVDDVEPDESVSNVSG